MHGNIVIFFNCYTYVLDNFNYHTLLFYLEQKEHEIGISLYILRSHIVIKYKTKTSYIFVVKYRQT